MDGRICFGSWLEGTGHGDRILRPLVPRHPQPGSREMSTDAQLTFSLCSSGLQPRDGAMPVQLNFSTDTLADMVRGVS